MYLGLFYPFLLNFDHFADESNESFNITILFI